ncbi:hypothetical protein DIPPA_35216 [Diplonema papillatum]|nr:hypothetical protein DIPPA_35216 [Diplonema papillatum]
MLSAQSAVFSDVGSDGPLSYYQRADYELARDREADTSSVMPLPMPSVVGVDSWHQGFGSGGDGRAPSAAPPGNETEDEIYEKKRRQLMSMLGGSERAADNREASQARARHHTGGTPRNERSVNESAAHALNFNSSRSAVNGSTPPRPRMETMHRGFDRGESVERERKFALDLGDKERVIRSMEAALGCLREELVAKDALLHEKDAEASSLRAQVAALQTQLDSQPAADLQVVEFFHAAMADLARCSERLTAVGQVAFAPAAEPMLRQPYSEGARLDTPHHSVAPSRPPSVAPPSSHYRGDPQQSFQ